MAGWDKVYFLECRIDNFIKTLQSIRPNTVALFTSVVMRITEKFYSGNRISVVFLKDLAFTSYLDNQMFSQCGSLGGFVSSM